MVVTRLPLYLYLFYAFQWRLCDRHYSYFINLFIYFLLVVVIKPPLQLLFLFYLLFSLFSAGHKTATVSFFFFIVFFFLSLLFFLVVVTFQGGHQIATVAPFSFLLLFFCFLLAATRQLQYLFICFFLCFLHDRHCFYFILFIFFQLVAVSRPSLQLFYLPFFFFFSFQWLSPDHHYRSYGFPYCLQWCSCDRRCTYFIYLFPFFFFPFSGGHTIVALFYFLFFIFLPFFDCRQVTTIKKHFQGDPLFRHSNIPLVVVLTVMNLVIVTVSLIC